jgi:hypothetical protein
MPVKVHNFSSAKKQILKNTVLNKRSVAYMEEYGLKVCEESVTGHSL